jgi:hypothetical protein
MTNQTPNAKLKLSLFYLLFLVIASTFFSCQKEQLTLDDFNLNGLGLYQAEVDNSNMVTSWNRKKLSNNGTNFETENCN